MKNKLTTLALVVLGVLVVVNSVSQVILYTQVRTVANHAVHSALQANAKAAQGRSVSLCDALYTMAVTPAANKLHPVFANLYVASGCEIVTHKKP